MHHECFLPSLSLSASLKHLFTTSPRFFVWKIFPHQLCFALLTSSSCVPFMTGAVVKAYIGIRDRSGQKEKKERKRSYCDNVGSLPSLYYFDVISPESGWKDCWGLSLSKSHGNPSWAISLFIRVQNLRFTDSTAGQFKLSKVTENTNSAYIRSNQSPDQCFWKFNMPMNHLVIWLQYRF